MNNIVETWFRPDMPRPYSDHVIDRLFSLQSEVLALTDPEDQELRLDAGLGDCREDERELWGSRLVIRCFNQSMSLYPQRRKSTIDVRGNFEAAGYEYREDGYKRNPLVTLIMREAQIQWPDRTLSPIHTEFQVPITSVVLIINSGK